MHEPKRMHELVHGTNQVVVIVKASGVQVNFLVPSSHAQLAFALGAWVDGDVVGALCFCRDKGDAGEHVGEVVHCLSRQGLQVCEKYVCWKSK